MTLFQGGCPILFTKAGFKLYNQVFLGGAKSEIDSKDNGEQRDFFALKFGDGSHKDGVK